MKSTLVFTAVALTLLLTASVNASVPMQLNFQGLLKNAQGDTASPGTYFLRFRIYDAPVGGVQVWESFDPGQSDPYVPVGVEHGLYNYILGSDSALPLTLASYDSLWLGVRVQGDPSELAPRIQLTSVMYSFRSYTADSSRYADSSRISAKAWHAFLADTALFVDTSGFSAYADFLSEGRIGGNPDQVSPGDHVHLPGAGNHISGSTSYFVSVSGTNTFNDASAAVTLELPAPAIVLLMNAGNINFNSTVQSYGLSTEFNVDEGTEFAGCVGITPFPWTNQSSSVPASCTGLTSLLPAGTHTFRIRLNVSGGPYGGSASGILYAVVLH